MERGKNRRKGRIIRSRLNSGVMFKKVGAFMYCEREASTATKPGLRLVGWCVCVCVCERFG